MAPECVNVDDGECAVALLGYGNAPGLAPVMNEIVCVKKRLP
jgi:hypothetical protein